MISNRNYFTTQELTQRLDLTLHLIENRQKIPLIRGELGIGKSSFAAHVRQLAPENWSVCLFEADTSLSPHRLLDNVGECCGCAGQHDDALQGLVDCFESIRDKGQVPVLLIDDAQLLPVYTLITLLKLFECQHGGESLVSIVLFADKYIEHLLATPQVRMIVPQAIQVIDLPNISRAGAKNYMDFMLKQAGLPAHSKLHYATLARLYHDTDGLPGPLGQAILKRISKENEVSLGKISGSLQAFVLGFMGLILIGMVVIYLDQINLLVEMPSAGQSGTALEGRLEAKSAFQAGAVVSKHLPLEPQDTDKRHLLAGQESLMASMMRPAQPAVEPLAVPDKPRDELPVQLSQGIDESTQTHVSVEPEINDLNDGNLLTTLPTHPATRTETVANRSAQASKSRLLSEQETKPKTLVPDPPVDDKLPADSLRKEAWIRTRPPGHYTLQLLGVENLQALKGFVSRHSLQKQAFYYNTLHRGKPWHPLLWGEFPDKKSAIQASKQLPPEVRSNGYWLRSFGDLQAQIKEN